MQCTLLCTPFSSSDRLDFSMILWKKDGFFTSVNFSTHPGMGPCHLLCVYVFGMQSALWVFVFLWQLFIAVFSFTVFPPELLAVTVLLPSSCNNFITPPICLFVSAHLIFYMYVQEDGIHMKTDQHQLKYDTFEHVIFNVIPLLFKGRSQWEVTISERRKKHLYKQADEEEKLVQDQIITLLRYVCSKLKMHCNRIKS